MRASLQGNRNQLPYFHEHNENTLYAIKIKGDNKSYYILKWRSSQGIPDGVLPRYSENGNKVNKIMTASELDAYLTENMELPETLIA